jgi:hypothetical protein
MRMKVLVAGLIAAIAVAFLLEPEAENNEKRRKGKQRTSAVRTEAAGDANVANTENQAQIESRYTTFPPERDSVIESALKKRGKRSEEVPDAWSARSWLAPAHKANIQVAQAQPFIQQQVSAPSLPKIPFEFIGAMDATNGGQAIFLRQGDNQLSVQAGEVIDQQWRVERLAADRVIFKYLPTNTETFIARGQIAE